MAHTHSHSHSHCGIFICEQPELLDPHLGHLRVEQQDGIRPDSDRASALGLQAPCLLLTIVVFIAGDVECEKQGKGCTALCVWGCACVYKQGALAGCTICLMSFWPVANKCVFLLPFSPLPRPWLTPPPHLLPLSESAALAPLWGIQTCKYRIACFMATPTLGAKHNLWQSMHLHIRLCVCVYEA